MTEHRSAHSSVDEIVNRATKRLALFMIFLMIIFVDLVWIMLEAKR